jgi:hypothetical protein
MWIRRSILGCIRWFRRVWFSYDGDTGTAARTLSSISDAITVCAMAANDDAQAGLRRKFEAVIAGAELAE